MRFSNELRVGIMFLTGLILLVLVIVTLTRWGEGRNTYAFNIRFTEAQGIQHGAPVRVAGVTAGQVSEISLDPKTYQALVTVRLDQQIQVHRNYIYAIGMSGLVGERYVEITPVTENAGPFVIPGETVDGTTSTDLDELMANANVLIGKLSTASDALNQIMGDKESQKNIKAAIANFRVTSEESIKLTRGLNRIIATNEDDVNVIIDNIRDVSADINEVTNVLGPQLTKTQSIKNFEAASVKLTRIMDRAERIAASLDTLVCDPQVTNDVRTTIINLRQASNDLNAVMADAKLASGKLPRIATNIETASNALPSIASYVEDASKILPSITGYMHDASKSLPTIAKNVEDASTSLPTITQNVAEASKSLPTIAKNVEQASNDLPTITSTLRAATPEVAANITQASRNLRDSSCNLGQVISQVSKTATTLSTLRIEPEGRVMLLAGDNDGSNARADLNLNVYGCSSMFRLGLAEIGDDTTVNAQFGNRLRENLWFRYGLIQSQFGIGVDYGASPNLYLSGELFDPDHLRANLLLDYRIRPLGTDWWFTTGFYNLFDDNTLGIGLTYVPGR